MACHTFVCVWDLTVRRSAVLLGWAASSLPLVVFPSLQSEAPLTAHTLTCLQICKGCQIFSLINWLYFILFNTATSLAFLECPSPHTCCTACERSPLALLSNFDLWWFDELQRDSGRVYGTAESGISSASFKVLHLTLVPVIFATPFPLSIFHVFPLFFFPVFRSFLFCTKRYRFFLKRLALILILKIGQDYE